MSCFFFFFFWRSPGFGRKNRLNFGEDLFFFGDILLSAGKTVSTNSKLMEIWVKFLSNTLRVGPWKIFKSENGPRVEKGWEPLAYYILTAICS